MKPLNVRYSSSLSLHKCILNCSKTMWVSEAAMCGDWWAGYTGHGWDLSEKKCHRQTISSCHPQHHHYPAHNGLGWQQWSIECRREGGGGSPVEGGLGVAGLLLDLLQPGALELGPRVAAAQPGPGLGRVVIVQLAHSHSQLLSIVNYAYCLYVTELSSN